MNAGFEAEDVAIVVKAQSFFGQEKNL